MEELKGERAPSSAHKERELKQHIKKLVPALWEDLVESVNEEQDIVYNEKAKFREQEQEKSRERRGRSR